MQGLFIMTRLRLGVDWFFMYLVLLFGFLAVFCPLWGYYNDVFSLCGEIYWNSPIRLFAYSPIQKNQKEKAPLTERLAEVFGLINKGMVLACVAL